MNLAKLRIRPPTAQGQHDQYDMKINESWVVLLAGLLFPIATMGTDLGLEALRDQAMAGDIDAQVAVGELYDFGIGVAEDNHEAAKWYRMAAEQGAESAQHNLGNILRGVGSDVQKDEAEAFKWYQLAAEQGNAGSQHNVAKMLSLGAGIPQNHAEAFKWMRLSAEQGLADSQRELAGMYQKGNGVVENDVEAVKWLRLAAEQGDPRAQAALGNMYEDGKGITQNLPEANKWYRRAAAQGQPDAQNNLGAMYYNGQGVPENDAEAYFWFLLAAATDSKNNSNRELARVQLSQAQVADVQARAATWRPIMEVPNPRPKGPKPVASPSRPPPLATLPDTHSSEQPSQSSLSVDTAVTTSSARIRETPNGTVILTVAQGASLALIDPNGKDGWYEVIDIDSGTHGWIHESVANIALAPDAPAVPLFTATPTGADGAPAVHIGNRTSRTIWLRVAGRTHSVAPHGELDIELESGSHRYVAWAPGVVPSIGSEAFERGHSYTWDFSIVTRTTGRRRTRR